MVLRSLALVVVSVCLLGAPATILAGSPGCGCERPATTACCKHHCLRHCKTCCQPAAPAPAPRAALPPSGAIYESVPMARAGLLYATPMMYAPVQRVAMYEDRAPSLPRDERTCEASSQRLSELEERVNRLRDDVSKIEQAMDKQLDLLQAIKTKLDAK